MQNFSDRMKNCYQLVVSPWDQCIKHDLDRLFSEAAGPHAELDTSELYGPKDTLILESIIKPYTPDFTDIEKGLLQAGTSLEVTIQPELKGKGDILFPQLTIIFVDKHCYADDYQKEEYWSKSNVPEFEF